MISKMELRFGSSQAGPKALFDVSPVTVFVGPNNAGKSSLLREIHHYCCHADPSVLKILEKLEFQVDPDQIHDLLRQATISEINDPKRPDAIIVGKGSMSFNATSQMITALLTDPNSDVNYFCNYYLCYNTLWLDALKRIDSVKIQDAGDLQTPPSTPLQVLFRDDKKRALVRQMLFDAFGWYFTVDPTDLGRLRIRCSERTPASGYEERGLHAEACLFHSKARRIDDFSDGVKAYTGIITEIVAGDPHVVLIDEPEAFLHPPLAAKLGREMAQATATAEKRLFISTHDPNIVMGCIQSGVPTTIVRLTYLAGVPTARVISADFISKLMRDPLLRSTGVINALFHDAVVVTEADADRAFYQEVNERLLQFQPGAGITGCLFLNAQNRQTIPRIVEPLRKMGIPAVGVVDLDVLRKDKDAEDWKRQLIAANIPRKLCNSLTMARNEIQQAISASPSNWTDGGIDTLNAGDKDAAENLLRSLSDYGLFVVPRGALESWLKHLGGGVAKGNWLIRIFEQMGDNPTADSYVEPETGDVWEFVGKMRGWCSNPERKGIPD
jgi:ABC-type Mn2+/Zn2+ transport system ATPase subunit